jgi:hypothetical protein
MTYRSRLIRTWVGSALLMFATAGLAQAQDVTQQPANTQLPRQTIPTGEEDAPRPAAAARSAAAADTQKLERELVRMTSESDQGLVAVKQSDNSVRVNLDDRFMSVLVATPTSDGGSEISCHTGHEALEKVKHAQQIASGALPKPAPTSTSKPAAAEEK